MSRTRVSLKPPMKAVPSSERRCHVSSFSRGRLYRCERMDLADRRRGHILPIHLFRVLSPQVVHLEALIPTHGCWVTSLAVLTGYLEP